MNQIAELLPAANIVLDLDVGHEERAVRRGRARCSSAASGSTRATVAASLAAREKLGSTGLGQGIAIPHGRIKGLREARGAFVRLAHADPVRRARRQAGVAGVRAARARAGHRAAPAAPVRARADVLRARVSRHASPPPPTPPSWRALFGDWEPRPERAAARGSMTGDVAMRQVSVERLFDDNRERARPDAGSPAARAATAC